RHLPTPQRRGVGDLGGRLRDRDPAQAPGPSVRTLLPGGQGPIAANRWYRPRARHRQTRGRQPRRPGDRRVRPGSGITVHPASVTCRTRNGATAVTRVLIVEDEEAFADPLAFLLRKEGFTPVVAGTGDAALAEFDAAGADIVLLDL